jgi:hypothetical protein
VSDTKPENSPFPLKTIARNLLIFGLVTLIFGEVLFRRRYAEPQRTATPEILAIQQHLQLHPEIGFTWKPNISEYDNITFESQDAETYPLSTDEFGFINTPEAIANRQEKEPVDIVGLGDSFLEHGTHVLTEYFATQNLRYYNLAMHRQSPPQYTDILETIALSLKPKFIVYSVFENDFQEVMDYHNWKVSDLDWFTYHSNTWCGAPIPQSKTDKLLSTQLRGYNGLYNVIQSKLMGDALSINGSPDGSHELILNEIKRSHYLAQEVNTQFVVLFIPSRDSGINQPTFEALAYEPLIEELNKAGIPNIQLISTFRNNPDPASLYYQINGHWNPKGITIAANTLQEHFKSQSNSQETQ